MEMVFVQDDFTPEAWAAIMENYSNHVDRLVCKVDAQAFFEPGLPAQSVQPDDEILVIQ